MRVLILSCNTGEGHNSCAKALKEAFDSNGDHCVIEDGLKLISKNISRFFAWGHVFMYRHIPSLFSWGYKFAETHSGAFKENKIIYKFFASASDNLGKLIAEGNYDTVVCTHPFTSLMLTDAKKKYGINVKSAFVATDYTCSPTVKDSNLDYYFIPSHLLEDEFLCENIPSHKIINSGIPIRQMFFEDLSKEEAKKVFGVDPKSKHIVLMCGSMGCGPIEKLVRIFSERLKESETLSVVCGTNSKLKEKLERKYGNKKNIGILGFVENVSALFDSADVYLTKPGGISVTEAGTKKLPMVFINAVSGCEDYNCEFYLSLGGAFEAKTEEEAVSLTESLEPGSEKYLLASGSFEKAGLHNGALHICEVLKGNCVW